MQKDKKKIYKKIIALVSPLLAVTFFLLPIATVRAQLAQGLNAVNQTAVAAGMGGGTDIITIVGRIIYILLGFVGVIFLVLLLYAGFLWMTAGGDPAKVTKAKDYIKNAIIGLIIITSAWAITAFIMNALGGVVGGGGVGGGGGAGGVGGLVGSSGSLGHGIIEYHLPERNATDVPRNTPVIITFKEAIDPASFIDGWTEETSSTAVGLNAANVKIYRTGDQETALTTAQARVNYTYDMKTFVIRPTELLGSPTSNVKYTVKLVGGNSGILLQGGGAAFSGAFSNGYEWGFEVSTFLDLTPPKVVAATPYQGGKYARNVVIQLTFNEAVDPTGASGFFENGKGFTNIGVRPNGGVGTPLNGEFKISNQYRTVEFLTADKCGVNSCGKDVFCLPPDATLEVVAKSATLSDQPPQAQFTTQGFDGITDVVGNSLDGNANDVADGPPFDDYSWSFGTSNEIKLIPPKIEETVPDATPGAGQSNRPLDEKVLATFDGLLQASTLNTEAAYIEPRGPGETDPDTFWYSVGMNLLTPQNTPIGQGEVASKGQVFIKHRPYLPSDEPPAVQNYYNPFLLSDIQDAYQNCFNPAESGTCKGKPNCCNNSPKDKDCAFKP
ncbi:Ig-like domain-containing protein [Patescibacteria group bacterium]|nr:Ig-like domain-containing protein [Patescibacteria group bacterium]MBU1034739.1 Ig-like domain-containing protein [Patescibacteria group bacterium]MBU1630047.1 Ig-like domain-containing protein [Patescibacteria group bacterium]